MKLTNRQLLNAVPAFNHLNSMKLPVKASYRVAKAARKVDDVLKDYRKTLGSLQEKHAEKGVNDKVKTDDNHIVFKDAEAFSADFEELLKLENDVVIDKISVADFGSAEVEPSFLYHLDWFIED